MIVALIAIVGALVGIAAYDGMLSFVNTRKSPSAFALTLACPLMFPFWMGAGMTTAILALT